MKMNNKGFTLVELLAIILLLALITSVSASAVVGFINTSKEKSHTVLIKNIKIGAEELFKECENRKIISSSLPESLCEKLILEIDEDDIYNGLIPEKYFITDIKSLINFGFLKSNDIDENNNKIIKNPKTDENMNDCKVKIIKFNNENSVWYEVINESAETKCDLSIEE